MRTCSPSPGAISLSVPTDRQSEIGLRESEQPHRRTTEDYCLVGLRNRQRLHLPDTIKRPHIEGIVAPQQHTLRAARGYQELERRPSVHYGVEQEDRKSTRLNSSHLGISYAVFCL